MLARGTATAATKPKRQATAEEIRTATLRQTAVQAFRALRLQGVCNAKAARAVGFPFMTLYGWGKAMDDFGFDGLLPKRHNSGRKPKVQFTPAEVADVRALVLQTNRTFRSGSNPEALRVAIRRGLLSEATAAMIRARFEHGQAPLTESMRDQVRVAETTIQAHRGPRNAWLQQVQSPGSLHLTKDPLIVNGQEEAGAQFAVDLGGEFAVDSRPQPQGEEREIEPGEKWTMDDGTINFVCCVPMNLPGNKCTEKFGVMVGRFQFLLVVDHRSYFIPGFSYTARPRSSYRAEDLTATLHTVFVEHGFPRVMVLEHGVSASKLLTDTLTLLGVRIERADSPHQKVVEFVFNTLWTKLSLMPGQVGRFQGEEEDVNTLVMSCRAGATDPRLHFPLLADVLKALHEAIAEWNEHGVKSRQYGSWQPREFFERMAPRHLRRLEPEQAWMFSPVITDAITVRGFKVRKTVCLMEGYSEVFDLSAEWMHAFNGRLVKLYFNPFAPDCVATVVAAASFNNIKAGTVLGQAEQINRMTRFRRRALGYGEDPDIGLDATRRNAQALRRSVVAIQTNGSTGAQTHEARNGVGQGELATNIPAPVVQRPLREKIKQRAAGVSDDAFERQAARLEREEQRAARAGRKVLEVKED